jgi:hypothetical protein
MNKIRKQIIVISFTTFAVTLGISIYLTKRAETLSKHVWAEYAQFMNTNSYVIGCEGFMSDDKAKEAAQLRDKALNSEGRKLSCTLSYFADIEFKMSIACIVICLLTLAWNFLRKFAPWLFNNPQKAILIFAAGFFISTLLIPPCISAGHIYYDSILTLFWNGVRIFWALLLIEWTVILLPLGLIYRRLMIRAK